MPTGLRGKRILIVEDEALVSMLIEDELLDAGATIVGSAATVSDALRLIGEAQIDGEIDAAVLDLNIDGKTVMPVADQLALLGVPFLFATGYGEDCDRGSHTAAPVLSKPYTEGLIVSAISALACASRRRT